MQLQVQISMDQSSIDFSYSEDAEKAVDLRQTEREYLGTFDISYNV